MQQMTQRYLNHLTYEIIGAAIDVHKELGPGLLEQVYESCLDYELKRRHFKIIRQQSIPIQYKGYMLDASLRFDLLVEDHIIVGLKAEEKILPVFEAQLVSYMHLMEKPKGILLNFCCLNICRDGQKTFVNDIFRSLPKI
jgi:GxxExxY protein